MKEGMKGREERKGRKGREERKGGKEGKTETNTNEQTKGIHPLVRETHLQVCLALKRRDCKVERCSTTTA